MVEFQRKLKQEHIKSTNIYFADVIGNDEAKEELMDIVHYFKNPELACNPQLISRGVLLHGPTGTGKTSLAKACACESNINFL